MADLPQSQGLTPQFTRPEESTTDLLQQILVELRKINSQLIIITDTVIKEQDVINSKEDDGP